MMKYKLKEICDFINGRAYKQSELLEKGKYKVLRVGNFFTSDKWYYSNLELDEDKYCNDGDLLYAWSANFGPKIWNGNKTIFHYHIWKIKVKENVDKFFLYYKLKQLTESLKYITHGSVMMHLTKNDMENIVIDIPEITTQKRISKILMSIDDKIESNNQINDNLYEISEALYDKDFTRKEYSKIIGDYIKPRRGKNLLKKEAVQGNVPVVAGGLEPSTYHNKPNTKTPVVTISASGANAGYVNLWEVPVWSSDSSFIDYSVTPNVYFWFVSLKKRQKEIYDSQTGSAQPHIYPMHIMNLPMADISETEIKKFNINAAPLFAKIGKLKKENEILSQLRDTLLPKLMNGEINLDNLEI